MQIPNIDPADFHYHLPEDRIALYPADKRDNSKLLVYKNREVSHTSFGHLPQHLPSQSLLVFNNSKVIPARIFFANANGATIELLCLHPLEQAVQQAGKNEQTWRCIVGNLKRWKSDETLSHHWTEACFEAALLRRGGEENDIRFSWEGDLSFFDLLEAVGKIPLPPYMQRDASDIDKERYQTVYAHVPGSVAAPTAGLHFTSEVMDQLSDLGVGQSYVTLHVGAGTFKPIKATNVAEHVMHQEFFEIDASTLQQLKESETTIAVGTTSARTLESVYHLGNALLNGEKNLLHVPQWAGFVHQFHCLEDCLDALLEEMNRLGLTKLASSTSLMIVPGYQFRVCKGIVTNFHQPESSLMLLIAALVGEDWKKIYDHALQHDFRFLSYGDSSLLLP